MQRLEKNEIASLTERLKSLGYKNRNQVRMYGEQLELTSDPVPQNDGFVVEAKCQVSGKPRRVRIPASVVQMARQQKELLKAA
jgi:hypothetical protein